MLQVIYFWNDYLAMLQIIYFLNDSFDVFQIIYVFHIIYVCNDTFIVFISFGLFPFEITLLPYLCLFTPGTNRLLCLRLITSGMTHLPCFRLFVSFTLYTSVMTLLSYSKLFSYAWNVSCVSVSVYLHLECFFGPVASYSHLEWLFHRLSLYFFKSEMTLLQWFRIFIYGMIALSCLDYLRLEFPFW